MVRSTHRDKKLSRQFFARSADQVAQDLLGRTIVREREAGATLYGRIHEVAAWEAKKGMIKESLYGPGTLMRFISRGYPIMGIATNDVGVYSCVTVLGASITDKRGDRGYFGRPSHIVSALEINPELNMVPIDIGPVWIADEGLDPTVIIRKNSSRLPVECKGIYALDH